MFSKFWNQAKNRNELREYLSKNGIGTLTQWGSKAIHQFKGIGMDKNLPVTDKIFSEILMLPLNLFINEDDVKYIIEKIKDFYVKN